MMMMIVKMPTGDDLKRFAQTCRNESTLMLNWNRDVILKYNNYNHLFTLSTYSMSKVLNEFLSFSFGTWNEIVCWLRAGHPWHCFNLFWFCTQLAQWNRSVHAVSLLFRKVVALLLQFNINIQCGYVNNSLFSQLYCHLIKIESKKC